MSMADSHYEMLVQLEEGEVVDLWLAQQTGADNVSRLVVVKRVCLDRLSSPQFVTSLVEAARRATTLQHPAIGPVFDVDVEGDDCYIVSCLIRGESLGKLSERIKAMGYPALQPAVTLKLISNAAAALHYAHNKTDQGQKLNIVHGGISAKNIFVDYLGQVLIANFDWASTELLSAATGTLIGDPHYMSPEQCLGSAVDARSDIFSLGVVLWELLAGKRLFPQADDFERMEAICEDVAPPPSQFNKTVPPLLDAILAKALAKDPSQRFPDCLKLQSALEKVLARMGKPLTPDRVGGLLKKLFKTRSALWTTLLSAEGRGDAARIIQTVEHLYSSDDFEAPAKAEEEPTTQFEAPTVQEESWEPATERDLKVVNAPVADFEEQTVRQAAPTSRQKTQASTESSNLKALVKAIATEPAVKQRTAPPVIVEVLPVPAVEPAPAPLLDDVNANDTQRTDFKPAADVIQILEASASAKKEEPKIEFAFKPESASKTEAVEPEAQAVAPREPSGKVRSEVELDRELAALTDSISDEEWTGPALDEDDDDDAYVEPFPLNDVIDVRPSEPGAFKSEGKGKPVLEVLRCSNGFALGSVVLKGSNRKYRPPQSEYEFSLAHDKAILKMPGTRKDG